MSTGFPILYAEFNNYLANQQSDDFFTNEVLFQITETTLILQHPVLSPTLTLQLAQHTVLCPTLIL